MKTLFLFILSLGGLILLLKWRVKTAQKRLIGTTLPQNAKIQFQHHKGVLYYFYRPMCGPCRRMTQFIDQLQRDYPGRVSKFIVTENRELTRALGIKETPTTVFIQDNMIIRAIIGSNSGKELLKLFQDEHS